MLLIKNLAALNDQSNTPNMLGLSAIVLDKLSVPGHPTDLDNSRARAYCACNRGRWGLFGHYFSRLSFLFSISLSLGDGPRYTEILSQVSHLFLHRASCKTYRVSIRYFEYQEKFSSLK